MGDTVKGFRMGCGGCFGMLFALFLILFVLYSMGASTVR